MNQKLLKALLKAGLVGVAVLLLVACQPAAPTAPPAEIVRVEVPGDAPDVVITQVNWTVVAPTNVPPTSTATPEATEAEPTNEAVTAVVSEWWDEVRYSNQVVFAHPWTSAATAYTVPAGKTVTLVGIIDASAQVGSDWVCVAYEQKYGWVDVDQLVNVAIDALIDVLTKMTANPADPSTDPCALMNPTPTPTLTPSPTAPPQ